MELSDRKLKILKAIIDDYIDTGVPVGSRTLSKKPGFDYSSATIRNEMADLEELGFLDQPHTSAGRTPSDKAYRLYVDRLMHIDRITKDEAIFIRNYFDARVGEISEVLESAAKALSDVTKHISMVTAPQLDSVKLKRIQIVKITDTKAMLIFVTDNGLVQDQMISVPIGMETQQLDMLSNMLTDKVQNVSLKEAEEIIKKECMDVLKEQKVIMGEILDAINLNREKKDLVFGGAQNILNYPEYRDIAKARHFLQLLETKDTLYKMLSNATDLEFSIKIGKENPYDDFKDMSIVTATYKIGGEKIGSFGVIGPTRMDYGRVLSVLNYVGMSLSDILSCLLETDKNK
ncbi:heat-inducible transcriptional repressor HrcA [Christensenella hongkongensis]|uniref:heat-inducible transcriptional repressor HrcA n=1 Tax=Christensenella hongkongensis TaxID=270498 RepID=UPI002672FDB4|nr:heat-inducible transcriptional repressor HrcA [Christensenella hongkongensis]